MHIEVIGFIFIVLSLFSITSVGFIGVLSANAFRFFVGDTYLGASVLLGFYGLFLLLKGEEPPFKNKRLIGMFLLYLGILLFLHTRLFIGVMEPGTNVVTATFRFFMVDLSNNELIHPLGGGMIGSVVYAASYFLGAQWGSYLLSAVFCVIGIFFIFQLSFKKALDHIRTGLKFTLHKVVQVSLLVKESIQKKQVEMKATKKRTEKKSAVKKSTIKESILEKENLPAADSVMKDKETINAAKGEQVTLEIDSYQQNTQQNAALSTVKSKSVSEQTLQTTSEESDKDEAVPLDFEISAEVENEDYQLPPFTLLNEIEHQDQSGEYKIVEKNVKKLEETFVSFGVDAKVVKARLGPAVTKYEVKPAIGVKVSKIVNLSDDIALSLAAKDIRMEAPIPGKSFIGIEVPNNEVNVVSFRDVMENYAGNKEKMLEVPLGRDISGNIALADLTKMPHLLIAGSTGSGKSVCINGIITSLLMKAKPNEVKLMMIDPKKVELNVYNGIPHLLTPVVTNPKKAAQALQKVVEEMERRYELFATTGMRNITGYNEHVHEKNAENGENQPTLPFIVVIVDELADLMMVASNSVEDAITRLAQMARAAGIHMILATQRPSVDVITGIIKANVPSRIAFAVSSGTDSRTIIDSNGAEKLLGRGDMLYLPMGQNKPARVQGAFLSDSEVERIVSFVTTQQAANYVEEMMPSDEPENSVAGEAEDELFDEAVSLVVDMETASISMLQRRFRIGYNRAARLMDEMEMRGIVGPSEGSKPRKVNLQKEAESIEEDSQQI
ncbi:DNA translocase FtsK [Desemzia sp. RIT 804]|uniref:DNA translocase FtsK n=1 Tax=Desemzia sp. RIT 804 TaxID=2810209 RepID=UPI0027148902|nr:DNA translocase FtsK [Desemzia sp. RIT 804]